MRYLVALIAALALVGCGEDEQEPTYDELIARWIVAFGDNAPDGQLLGRQREGRELEPLTCSFAGKDTTCYSADGACAAGYYPTVCFSDRAELLGCIQGEEQDRSESMSVVQLDREGRPMAAIGNKSVHGWQVVATFTCEKPAYDRPRS